MQTDYSSQYFFPEYQPPLPNADSRFQYVSQSPASYYYPQQRVQYVHQGTTFYNPHQYGPQFSPFSQYESMYPAFNPRQAPPEYTSIYPHAAPQHFRGGVSFPQAQFPAHESRGSRNASEVFDQRIPELSREMATVATTPTEFVPPQPVQDSSLPAATFKSISMEAATAILTATESEAHSEPDGGKPESQSVGARLHKPKPRKMGSVGEDGYERKGESRPLVPFSLADASQIKSLCRNRNGALAYSKFLELLKQGKVPDLNTTESLIVVLNRKETLDKCRAVFDKARELKLVNLNLYEIFLKILGEHRELEEIHERWNQMMKDDRIIPTAKIFSVLIKMYSDMGYFEQAIYLFEEEMPAYNVAPDAVIYNNFIALCAKQGNDEAMMECYRKMIAKIRPTIRTLMAVMSGLKNMNKLEKAIEFANEVDKFRLNPDFPFYILLMQTYMKVGNLHEAWNIYQAILKANFTFRSQDSRGFTVIINLLGMLGRKDDALFLFNNLPRGIVKNKYLEDALTNALRA